MYRNKEQDGPMELKDLKLALNLTKLSCDRPSISNSSNAIKTRNSISLEDQVLGIQLSRKENESDILMSRGELLRKKVEMINLNAMPIYN